MASDPQISPSERRMPRVGGSRLPTIVLGYVAGCLAAGLATPFGQIFHDIVMYGAPKALATVTLRDIAVIAVGYMAIALVSAAPFAVAFVMFLDRAGSRPAWLHAACGAATGMILAALSIAFGFSSEARSGIAAIVTFAFIGAIGGIAFWLVAGRTGAKPPRPRKPRP